MLNLQSDYHYMVITELIVHSAGSTSALPYACKMPGPRSHVWYVTMTTLNRLKGHMVDHRPTAHIAYVDVVYVGSVNVLYDRERQLTC